MTLPPEPKHESLVYTKANLGSEWDILAQKCEIPPSLEVFTHEWRQTLLREPGVRAAIVARRIAQSYRRQKLYPA